MKRRGDDGVVLINVLVVVALASSIALLMLTTSERTVGSLQRQSDLTRASALVRGAETSVVIALRRDLMLTPKQDHYGEDWFLTNATLTEIKEGTLSIKVSDAQSLYNINSAGTQSLGALQRAQAVFQLIKLEPSVAGRMVNRILRKGPYRNLSQLEDIGLSEDEIGLLSRVAIALPTDTEINLSTAPAPLLRVLIGNRIASARLLAMRTAKGFLDPADFQRVNTLQPQGTGLSSSYYSAVTIAKIGTATKSSQILIQRGDGSVRIIAR